MPSSRNMRAALTIAGSDSGGGAGIQADLKTFAAMGVHGTCAITCLTAQSPRGILGIQPCSTVILQQQLKAVINDLHPAAAKTGMLYSAAIVRIIAEFLARHPIPLVVDPVMISTSGRPLIRPSAVRALCDELLPLAALVTPNLHEAEVLVGERLRSPEDLRTAARQLHSRFGCAVLVKGGHLRRGRDAMDIFYDGRQELLLSAPLVRGVLTHGTGCTYSAAVTAYLARGLGMVQAVTKAKGFITKAIAKSRRVAGHWVLHWEGF